MLQSQPSVASSARTTASESEIGPLRSAHDSRSCFPSSADAEDAGFFAHLILGESVLLLLLFNESVISMQERGNMLAGVNMKKQRKKNQTSRSS